MKISNVKMLPISNANSNLGLATLALATLATLATFAASALPLTWRADWPDAKPVETLVHRGTDVELRPLWRINKEPADTNGWTYTTFCQTNAVGPWFGPMPGAFFSHTNDVGAAFYNVMVRAETPGGAVNYTAFARLRMLDSPGFAPGALPLPAQSIDFADVTTYNAPWLLPDATNDFARAGDIAPIITNTVTKQFVESLGIDAGTTNYADLANKPAVNGVTLAGDKTSAALGLASAADVQALQAFYLAEKRKTNPRFGVADNVSVVIDTNGVRHEVVTEGVIVGYEFKNALGLDPGVNILELYLAPTVSGLDAGIGDDLFRDVMTIVAYGNITTIGQDTFWTSYALELLSFAASTQTADVANNTVDFSSTAQRFTIGLPRDIYLDDAAMEKFYGWGLSRYVFAPLDNGAFTPTRNPYIVDTDTAFIAPIAQFDSDYRSRWDGPLSDVTPLNICGTPDMPNFTMTLDAEPSFGAISASNIIVTAGENGLDFYNGATIVVAFRVWSADNASFSATKAGSDDIAFNIQNGIASVYDASEYDIMPTIEAGYKPFGPILQSLVFRANQGGCTIQWMKNLGYSIHSEILQSDYTLSIGQLQLQAEEGSTIEFYALRIYDEMLTDEQVIRLCALDAGRFGLQ